MTPPAPEKSDAELLEEWQRLQYERRVADQLLAYQASGATLAEVTNAPVAGNFARRREFSAKFIDAVNLHEMTKGYWLPS